MLVAVIAGASLCGFRNFWSDYLGRNEAMLYVGRSSGLGLLSYFASASLGSSWVGFWSPLRLGVGSSSHIYPITTALARLLIPKFEYNGNMRCFLCILASGCCSCEQIRPWLVCSVSWWTAIRTHPTSTRAEVGDYWRAPHPLFYRPCRL